MANPLPFDEEGLKRDVRKAPDLNDRARAGNFPDLERDTRPMDENDKARAGKLSPDPEAGTEPMKPRRVARKESSMTVRSIKDARADWRRGLLLTKKDHKPKAGLANVLHVLSLHPEWADVLAYDQFAEAVVKMKAPPARAQDVAGRELGEWTETDSVRTAGWFAENVGFEPSTTHVEQAVLAIAERHRVHPVRDYLRSLTWDGVERLDGMLVTYFDAPDNEYVRAVSARFMISAVARVMQPGCQADCMLVAEGPQGRGKSTGFEALAGKEWFADTGICVGDKDSYQSLRRKWIYEFGELSSLKGREVERVKAFVSGRVDNYRPSYGRRNRDFARQVVFVGTTNDSEYLIDRTGNRRFWPFRCSRVDVAGIRRDRHQLWAEARERYEAGHPWHVNTPELRALCEQEQREREVSEPWEPVVRAWLASPSVPDGASSRRLLNLDDGITTADVLLGAIGMRAADMRHEHTIRAGHVLRRLDWHPTQVREEGDRVRRYFKAASQTAQTSPSTDCDDDDAESMPEEHMSQTSHTKSYARIESAKRDLHDEDETDRDNRDTVTGDDIEREAIQAEGGAAPSDQPLPEPTAPEQPTRTAMWEARI